MRPLEALAQFSREALYGVYRGLDEPMPDVHLSLCEDCTQALLLELSELFAPIMTPHTQSLEHSQVMGCTFEQGTPETCALHRFLHEDVVCP